MGENTVSLGNEEDGYAESHTIESQTSLAWSTVSPHYDASKDVILRMEFLSEKQMKVVVLSIWGSVLVGVGLLIMGLQFKVDKEQEYFLQDNTVSKVNLGFACSLFTGLIVTWFAFLLRVYKANITGKRWSIRRKKGATLAGVELSLQLINTLFFLIPNAYVLARDCAWFSSVVIWSGFVRWTCWNSIFTLFWVQVHNSHPAKGRWAKYVSRPDGALMDAPWKVHLPKAVMWGVFEAVLLALSLYLELHPGNVVVPPGTERDCSLWSYDCSFPGPALGLVITVNVLIVLYFVGLIYLFHRSFQTLIKEPYREYRIANFMIRLQVRLRVLAFMFFILSSVVYFFVRLNTCASFITSWMGFLSMQFVMSCLAAINAFIFMPKKPFEVGILQVWLQEFAWTEKDVPRKLEERASSLPPVCINRDELAREPIFCFETSIKMLYWSFLVYDLEEAENSPFDCDTALSLYDLEHFELFWEKTLDTKAIVGWNDNTVVISFRGTASLANVKADIQAWLTSYPRGQGTCMLCTAPMVHTGFYQAWTANGLNDKLISRLEHILYRCTNKQADGSGGEVNVYVTGHSLGGALATVCAFDIVNRCPCIEWSVNMHVYTFGAPRTGNHAFARLYNEKLPNTWHIINNADAVTRTGKFVKLYKRPGHRVLINRRGDLVVRPSFVEASIRNAPGANSVRDHLLTSYQRAMTAVVAAQFGKKSFQDGKDGILSLAEQKGTRVVLAAAGFGEDALQELQDLGEEAVKKMVGKVVLKKRARKKKGAQSGSAISSDGDRSADLDTELSREEPEVDSLDAGQASDAVADAKAPEDGQSAAETQDGILHKKGRRTCHGRNCHTVCSLLRPVLGVRGKKASSSGASPMCDASNYSHSGEPWREEGAGKVAEEARVEVVIDDPSSNSSSPHAQPTNTRGSIADMPDFQLIMDPHSRTMRSKVMVQTIKEEKNVSRSSGGGDEDDTLAKDEDAAAVAQDIPPAVVQIAPHGGG